MEEGDGKKVSNKNIDYGKEIELDEKHAVLTDEQKAEQQERERQRKLAEDESIRKQKEIEQQISVRNMPGVEYIFLAALVAYFVILWFVTRRWFTDGKV